MDKMNHAGSPALTAFCESKSWIIVQMNFMRKIPLIIEDCLSFS